MQAITSLTFFADQNTMIDGDGHGRIYDAVPGNGSFMDDCRECAFSQRNCVKADNNGLACTANARFDQRPVYWVLRWDAAEKNASISTKQYEKIVTETWRTIDGNTFDSEEKAINWLNQSGAQTAILHSLSNQISDTDDGKGYTSETIIGWLIANKEFIINNLTKC